MAGQQQSIPGPRSWAHVEKERSMDDPGIRKKKTTTQWYRETNRGEGGGWSEASPSDVTVQIV